LGGLSEEIELFQCLALGVDRNHLVPTGRIDGSVAQPLLNHGDIDSRQQQMAGGGVTPKMDGVKAFIFRLPGFNSKKYAQDFQVTVAREAPADQVYRPENFKVQSEEPERTPSGAVSKQRRAECEPLSQSERDWRYAIRKLQAGEDPQKIIKDMEIYRSQDRSDRTGKLVPAKAQPHYYAEHTVMKAMSHLGMTPPDKPAAREGEVQPSR